MIYFDLDGVLANFDKKVFDDTGLYPHQMSKKELFTYMKTVDRFYGVLEPIKPMVAVFKTVRALYGHGCEVLTALPLVQDHPTAQYDKVQWVKDHLGVGIQTNCVSRRQLKSTFCRDLTDILIDDNEHICNEWNTAGGIAVMHVSLSETLNTLKKLNIFR